MVSLRFQKYFQRVLDRSYIDSLYARRLEFFALFATAIVVSALVVLYAQYFSYAEFTLRSFLLLKKEWIFLITPICFLSAWGLVKYFSPEASGSGIPQIMAVIEAGASDGKVKLSGLLGFRIAVVKVFSSTLAVLGGGVVGREGPSLHFAASIYYGLYRQFSKHLPLGNPLYWVIAGSASGLAAAFNTPLGGIIYAVEEMGQLHLQKVKTQLLFAIFIAGMVSQAIMGPYLYIGSPQTSSLTWSLFGILTAISFFNGYFASFVADSLFRVMQWRGRLRSNKGQVVWIIVASLFVSSIVYFDSQAIGSGREYISQLLFERKDLHGFTPILRVMNNFITYTVGLAGGVFAPALAAGAGFAYFLGELFGSAVGASGINLVILVGMISFLVGFTRSPLTSFVLVLEMTDKHVSISSLMWAALISYVAARLYQRKGFYDRSMEKILSEHALADSLKG